MSFDKINLTMKNICKFIKYLVEEKHFALCIWCYLSSLYCPVTVKKKKLSKIILKSQYDVITNNFLTKKKKKLGI